MEDAVSWTHMRRMGSRLERIGEHRNAGLSEVFRRGGITLVVKLVLMPITVGRDCVCRAAQFMNDAYLLGGDGRQAESAM